MVRTLIAVVILLVSVALIWVFIKKKKQSEDKPVRYICDHCGEHNCDCRSETDE